MPEIKVFKIQYVNLEKELLLHVDGEVTKKHSLPWNVLRNLGDKLQDLVQTLAKYSLEEDQVTNLNNFTIDFIGFYEGSAVPAFKLNSQPVPTLYDETTRLKVSVNTDFSRVMHYVDKGNYQAIADLYNTSVVKNDVINKVYEFTNAAGTTPVQIVRRKKNNQGFTKVFKLRTLKKEVYDQLIIKDNLLKAVQQIPEQTAVGKIIVKQTKSGRISKKASEIYSEKEAVLSLKFDHIETYGRQYTLTNPILFQFFNEGKGILIENDQLDLVASGKNVDEAKANLFEQFDHTYQRLNEVPDEQLSKRLLSVKRYYNFIVKQVSEL